MLAQTKTDRWAKRDGIALSRGRGEVYEGLAGHPKVRFADLEPQDFRHLAVAAWFYHYQPFRTLKVVAA